MRKLWKLPVLLFATIISSCSLIEEQRGLCPCWYTIDLTEVDRSMQNLHLWIYSQDGELLCRETLQNSAYGIYEVKLLKGKAYCYVWGNISNSTHLHENLLSDSYLLKADSCSSDPLFHYSKVLDTDDELGRDTVVLRKEFALVDFTLKGKLEHKEDLQIIIRQPECGRSLSGGFVEGESSTYANPLHIEDSCSIFKFRLMRQSSLDGISAQITAANGAERVTVKEFPLGQWLRAIGYDMQAENMADITMELDLAIGLLYVKANDWQSSLPIIIEI